MNPYFFTRRLDRTRLAVLALLAAALLSAASAAHAQAQRYRLDIPAQPLTSALMQIGRQYDISVMAEDSLLQGLSAPAIDGTFSALEAVTQALASSGLAAQELASGGIVVVAADAARDSSPDASAASGGAKIEEVFVTALKREALLQDVPMSLTVFDSSEILSSNFVNFEDYALRTPNVSFQNNGGAARTLFTIRGVGGNNIASGTGTSVGMYVDEIILNPTGGLRQNDLALFDLERIEVLRGPQGTLFGRNTIGGAINHVTRKPSEEFTGRLTAGLERFNAYSVEGHVSVPISDRVFLQASALDRETDGFITEINSGEELGGGGTGGRLALRLLPMDGLQIDLAAMRNEVRYDALQAVAEESFDRGDYEVPLAFIPENEVQSDLYSARIEYTTENFNFVSITAYNEFDAVETIDITGFLGPGPAFLTGGPTQENLSQELRVESNDVGAKLRWLLGANYSKTDDLSASTVFLGDPANPGAAVLTQSLSGEAENTAVFASLDLELGRGYSLTAGGRYSWDDYELDPGAGVVFPGSSQEFTPSITLTYQADENSLLYATVSKGYRPGGVDTTVFNNMGTDSPITSEYGPEVAWNYELGANATFLDGLLTGRASLFYLDYEDIQSVFFLPPSNLDTITTNGAAAEIYGAEIDVHLYPTDYLHFNVNLGLLDSEFTDFADSPQGDLTGNELPFAPNVNFSAMAEYSWTPFDGSDAFLRAEYTYRSDQEGRNNNNPIEQQPGYDLLNLRAGIAFKNYELELYGENVLDEEYFTNRRPGPIVAVVPGRPAIWGIRGTARF
ncbi:MAG: TonB-dependent receptor [Pseudomonadota bacterium]